MFAREEKQFVADDRSSDCSTELIPLETIVRKRECISSVERAIAQKFKKISVKVVRARLCYRVHRTGGVEAVLGGQATGFHLELLQRVRKWKRQIQVIVGIVVVGSVQAIGQPRLHPACDLDDDRRVVSAAWIQRALRRRGCHSRQQDQLGDLPTIQWQLQHASVVDHLADARVACFHKRGVGLNFDRFGNLSHFHQNIKDGVASDLEHDSRSHITTKAGQRRLQAIRTDGEIWQNVQACFICKGRACYPSVGLRDLDFNSRQNCTTLIGHNATDLRR